MPMPGRAMRRARSIATVSDRSRTYEKRGEAATVSPLFYVGFAGCTGAFARQMWMGLPRTAIAASLMASECVGCAWQV